MYTAFTKRYHDVLASVYLFNEYQAYRGLERLLAALRLKYPEESVFIAAVEKHTRDERKHYLMFKRYFQALQSTPLAVDSTFGYIDQFVLFIFRTSLDDLDVAEILADDALFFRLCRLIMITEFRGMRQVDVLLRSRILRRDARLVRIFRIIERDEPSHCLPYQRWLRQRGSHAPGVQERLTDYWIHYSLVLVKLPLFFLHPRLKRLSHFPDEAA
ncbi:MAG: ferritin-like domain-containing protein [Bacteroidia bacterium]|nr:ferritin-like domain-containing protein [Bacteroidia bacterium]